ncbi:uncharacterized protein LOC108670183 isoform X2 [Hyalella azteca]|uniref:Uncharacterized protein LOC108670183 isoform X2 n=1 Tax=Hyalella azteca TaxID=294128 RepID=A0A8B7NHM3_HYAAZ|nr:uncharacterized protein LOC108670183 isoform X2 [Hyalella azteca]
MATHENRSDIKLVLKSYQNSAVKGLHGPSPFMNSESEKRNKKTDLRDSNSIKVLGYKKVLQREALLSFQQQTSNTCEKSTPKQSCEETFPKSCMTISVNRSFLHSQQTDCGDDGNLKSQNRVLNRPNLPGDTRQCHGFESFDADSVTAVTDGGKKIEDDLEKCRPGIVSNGKGNSYPYNYCNEEEKSLDKRAIASAALLQFHYQKEPYDDLSHDAVITRSSRASPNSYSGGWAEVGVFTPPSPFSPTSYSSPPHAPFPFVMGNADVCGGKSEALLLDHKVACFIVGGERRLCFPQVLCTALREFSMAQINAELQSLHIYLSLCSTRQLQVLKDACALPHHVTSCGLITYSDAHRLTHALVHANAPQLDPPKTVTLPYNSSSHQFVTNLKPSQHTPVNSHSTNQLTPNIIVSHRCFGKCRGWVYLCLYDSPDAKCIQCCECRSFYSPEEFVCHAHRSLETRTCHWGFDPSNWRVYLQLASDQPLQPAPPSNTAPILPETFLEKFKSQFSPNGIGIARPRQTNECDLGHGVRPLDETPHIAHRLHSDGSETRDRNNDVRSDCEEESSRDCVTIIDERLPGGGGANSSFDGELGRLATLSVPSKSGKSFAPPPAALVRESMPAPLPPNLRSKGPPMLVDPALVVPLSQYDKFRHYQPNITLAIPKHRETESARENSFCEVPLKITDKFGACDVKEVKAKDRHPEHSEVVSSNTLWDSSEKRALPNLKLLNAHAASKSYAISLPEGCKLSEETHYRAINEQIMPVIKDISSGPAERDVNNGKQYFTPQDLGLLSMSGASVPRDLQIIKLDSTYNGDGRSLRDVRGTVSSPTDLKIFKLAPPMQQRNEPWEFHDKRKTEYFLAAPNINIKEENITDQESESSCGRRFWENVHQSARQVHLLAQDDTSADENIRLREAARSYVGSSKASVCNQPALPRGIKSEVTTNSDAAEKKQIVDEIENILKRWSDKQSVSRILSLVQRLVIDEELGEGDQNAPVIYPTATKSSTSKGHPEIKCVVPHSQHEKGLLTDKLSANSPGSCASNEVTIAGICSRSEAESVVHFESNENLENNPDSNDKRLSRNVCVRSCGNDGVNEIVIDLKKPKTAVKSQSFTCDNETKDEMSNSSVTSTAEDSSTSAPPAIKLLVKEVDTINAEPANNASAKTPVETLDNGSNQRRNFNGSQGSKSLSSPSHSSEKKLTVNAAYKRHHQDEKTHEALSPKLQTCIYSSDTEMTQLKRELHCVKKQKTLRIHEALSAPERKGNNGKSSSNIPEHEDQQQLSKSRDSVESPMQKAPSKIIDDLQYDGDSKKSLSKTREIGEKLSVSNFLIPVSTVFEAEHAYPNPDVARKDSFSSDEHKKKKRSEYRPSEERSKVIRDFSVQEDNKSIRPKLSDCYKKDDVDVKNAHGSIIKAGAEMLSEEQQD